jgi:hypothetical protein
MRSLLASAGIQNTSIHDALVDLPGKPIAESNALCISTAIDLFPGGPSMAYRFISGSTPALCANLETVYTIKISWRPQNDKRSFFSKRQLSQKLYCFI